MVSSFKNKYILQHPFYIASYCTGKMSLLLWAVLSLPHNAVLGLSYIFEQLYFVISSLSVLAVEYFVCPLHLS